MIESVQNERIKNYAKLNRKKYRDSTDLFIVEGQHLVSAALAKKLVKEIFLLAGEENIYQEVTYVSLNVMRKLSDLTNSPKVLAICQKTKGEGITGNVIMLDDIKDPGNLGTIIRSAVAFNYQTVILSPETVDMYNSKVIRATEGMFFYIKIINRSLIETIKECQDNAYQIYGTDVHEGTTPSKTNKKHVLIIGSESLGINKTLLKECNSKLYIKMNEECESLNAAVSASILMYELNK